MRTHQLNAEKTDGKLELDGRLLELEQGLNDRIVSSDPLLLSKSGTLSTCFAWKLGSQ